MSNPIVPSKFDFLSNTIRPDGLVNITALAVAYTYSTGIRCNISEWLATKEATESIAYLASYSEIPRSELVIKVRGGNAGGTWVHPDLAEIFAQWISVEYRFAVVRLIRDAKEQKHAPRQLPPQRDIIEYIAAAKSIGIDQDPMLLSLFTQRLMETISPDVRAIDAPEQPLNVTSIATNLGYSQQQIGNGSSLGKYIKARHESLGTSQHGKYQCHVYLPSEVEGSIADFFNDRLAIAA